VFNINSVLVWPQEGRNRFERVLWFDKTITVVIDVLHKKARPVIKRTSDLEEDLREGRTSLTSISFPFMKVTEKELVKYPDKTTRRDQAMQVVTFLTRNEDIFFSKKSGPLVQAAMGKFKISKPSVYKYLQQYWQGGMVPNALLPNFRGKDKTQRNVQRKLGRPHSRTIANPDAKGVIITPEIEAFFAKGVALFYKGGGLKSLKDAYHQMSGKFFNRGYEVQDGIDVPVLLQPEERPSFWQFQYWYEKTKNPTEDKKRRLGEIPYNQKARPVLGNSMEEVFGPGDMYQIDATFTKEYIVSRVDSRFVVGQAVFYILTDVDTQLVSGLHIALEGPSWVAAMQALYNAHRDKVDFCAEYGITIQPWQWPCKGLPARILGDRGEFAREDAPSSLAQAFNVQVENTASYRPDWKPIVENTFGRLEKARLPWSCADICKANARGDFGFKDKAVLNIEDMYKILIQCILAHNERYLLNYPFDGAAAKAGVEPKPCKLWEWGMQGKFGRLKTFDEDLLKLNLLPSSRGRVTRYGILFKKVRYNCQMALERGWFDSLRGRSFKIVYDPRNMDTVYLFEPKEKRFYPCILSDPEQALRGLSDEERKLYLYAKKVNAVKADEADNAQNAVNLQTKIEAIRKNAEEKTMAALKERPITKTQRHKNMRENRVVERDALRGEEAWRIGGQSPQRPVPMESSTPAKQLTEKEKARQAMLEAAI